MPDSALMQEWGCREITIHFGPHHTILFEPIQINLLLEEEKVREVSFVKGYCERGIENSIKGVEYKQGVLVAERTCGICSFFHSVGYCGAVEKIKLLDVPPRAKFLRLIWSELQRVQSHYLRLALIVDAIGFESVSALILQAREHIMDILVLTTGSRIILPVNTVGGVRKDVTDEVLAILMIELKSVKKTFNLIEKIFENDYIIKTRLQGIGILPFGMAQELGTVGPVARASGIKIDLREHDELYKKLGFNCIAINGGDVYSRAIVRIKDIGQCIELIRNAINAIPCGETRVAWKSILTGEENFCLEQAEGKLQYRLVGKSRTVSEVSINTASDCNFRALEYVLKGSSFSNVPVIFVSMGLCAACIDK